MGGRGSSSGMAHNEKIEYGGRRMSLAKFLDDSDIRHANDASVMDMGDVIKRMFIAGALEINNLEFSDTEKKEFIDELSKLSTKALKASAGAISPYASGRSRLTNDQKTGQSANKAANARGQIDSYMKELRNKSAENVKKRKDRELISALSAAEKSGKLEVIIDGKRYYRKSRRGKYWYS